MGGQTLPAGRRRRPGPLQRRQIKKVARGDARAELPAVINRAWVDPPPGLIRLRDSGMNEMEAIRDSTALRTEPLRTRARMLRASARPPAPTLVQNVPGTDTLAGRRALAASQRVQSRHQQRAAAANREAAELEAQIFELEQTARVMGLRIEALMRERMSIYETTLIRRHPRGRLIGVLLNAETVYVRPDWLDGAPLMPPRHIDALETPMPIENWRNNA